MKPITPSEAKKSPGQGIPDAVILAFNQLIVDRFDGKTAVIPLKDAFKAVRQATGLTTGDVPKHWMNVESLFRKAGWKVEYEQPGYCESGEAAYTFSC